MNGTVTNSSPPLLEKKGIVGVLIKYKWFILFVLALILFVVIFVLVIVNKIKNNPDNIDITTLSPVTNAPNTGSPVTGSPVTGGVTNAPITGSPVISEDKSKMCGPNTIFNPNINGGTCIFDSADSSVYLENIFKESEKNIINVNGGLKYVANSLSNIDKTDVQAPAWYIHWDNLGKFNGDTNLGTGIDCGCGECQEWRGSNNRVNCKNNKCVCEFPYTPVNGVCTSPYKFNRSENPKPCCSSCIYNENCVGDEQCSGVCEEQLVEYPGIRYTCNDNTKFEFSNDKYNDISQSELDSNCIKDNSYHGMNEYNCLFECDILKQCTTYNRFENRKYSTDNNSAIGLIGLKSNAAVNYDFYDNGLKDCSYTTLINSKERLSEEEATILCNENKSCVGYSFNNDKTEFYSTITGCTVSDGAATGGTSGGSKQYFTKSTYIDNSYAPNGRKYVLKNSNIDTAKYLCDNNNECKYINYDPSTKTSSFYKSITGSVINNNFTSLEKSNCGEEIDELQCSRRCLPKLWNWKDLKVGGKVIGKYQTPNLFKYESGETKYCPIGDSTCEKSVNTPSVLNNCENCTDCFWELNIDTNLYDYSCNKCEYCLPGTGDIKCTNLTNCKKCDQLISNPVKSKENLTCSSCESSQNCNTLNLEENQKQTENLKTYNSGTLTVLPKKGIGLYNKGSDKYLGNNWGYGVSNYFDIVDSGYSGINSGSFFIKNADDTCLFSTSNVRRGSWNCGYYDNNFKFIQNAGHYNIKSDVSNECIAYSPSTGDFTTAVCDLNDDKQKFALLDPDSKSGFDNNFIEMLKCGISGISEKLNSMFPGMVEYNNPSSNLYFYNGSNSINNGINNNSNLSIKNLSLGKYISDGDYLSGNKTNYSITKTSEKLSDNLGFISDSAEKYWNDSVQIKNGYNCLNNDEDEFKFSNCNSKTSTHRILKVRDKFAIINIHDKCLTATKTNDGDRFANSQRDRLHYDECDITDNKFLWEIS